MYWSGKLVNRYSPIIISLRRNERKGEVRGEGSEREGTSCVLPSEKVPNLTLTFGLPMTEDRMLSIIIDG